MKALHRLIVTSNTYRQASTGDAACEAVDPENHWLWRFESRRMEAELVRDSVFAVAGQLDLAMGGPEIDCKDGLTSKRRSLYFRHAPEKQMVFLQLFDAAAPTECYQRRDSVIPQQALALVNSELTIAQSRLLARRLAVETDPRAFVITAFEQVLSRRPTEAEIEPCVRFLDQQQTRFAQQTPPAGITTSDPADSSKPAADPALRARENLVHVLMNHNDFVTIR